ncbi:MAG: IS200/IS605 family transposase [Clostridiales bacterium]|jgi:putative transposase|nr:IS200/IS605 family transposase [Clostridiales bacterium]
MPADYNRGNHTVYDIKYHIVWITKYRYKMLVVKVAERLRELIRQGCDARGLTIVKGSVGKDHVHLLQNEFPKFRKRYWGQHLWAQGYFCATVGSVDEETIKKYIEQQDLTGEGENFKIDE